MLEHWCGLRVGDVAATRIAGIVDEQRTVTVVCYDAVQRPCARVETVTLLGKQASSFIW